MGNDNPVTSVRRLVAAPDKFRGTATAAEVVAGIERAATGAGWACDGVPVADGGEGTLEALGGAPRYGRVRGPLGDTVVAEWRLQDDGTAVVEMARASGLALAGGPDGNDPLRATTYGTGELIAAAIEAGADRVVVAVGGSATTDGGVGALSALRRAGVSGTELPTTCDVIVACDVRTTFLDAAERFAPQKGATPAQVSLLRRRLERLAEVYLEDYGVDVRGIPGSGAAGGLAGGLAAAGATLVPGFEVVAEALGLAGRIDGADLVVTGEGRFDARSIDGKAAGGVLALAAAAGVPVLVVAGDIDRDGLAGLPDGVGPGEIELVSLVERFGAERAYGAAVDCVTAVVAARLAR
jgi:glycerate 2-kinase